MFNNIKNYLAGTPSAPTNVRTVKETNGWVLYWSPPETDGGEPILSYAVEFRYNKKILVLF